MYRRYEPQQNQQKSGNTPQNHQKNSPQNMRQKRQSPTQNHHSNHHSKPEQEPPRRENKSNREHPLTKFIPQSVYDPKSGKILGFLSAEDLLIVALILLMIDSEDEEADNSMLVYALIYILISEHIDLPF